MFFQQQKLEIRANANKKIYHKPQLIKTCLLRSPGCIIYGNSKVKGLNFTTSAFVLSVTPRTLVAANILDFVNAIINV